jgi:hypothetical protein
MGASCCKGFYGKFRQNKVVPGGQSSSSTSASTVISCTRVSTKSDILMARTAEENHCQSALRSTEALDMYTAVLKNIQKKLQLPTERKTPSLAVYDQTLQEVDGNLKAMLLGHVFSWTMLLISF